MQKLLSLKDEQLARLQDQVLTEAAEGAEEPATEAEMVADIYDAADAVQRGQLSAPDPPPSLLDATPLYRP